MQSTEFGAEDWIECLAGALRKLAKAQEPYLQEYYRQHLGGHVLLEEQGGKQPAFELDDCRDLYAMAHHSHVLWGMEILCSPEQGAGPGSEYFTVASHAGAGREPDHRPG